MCLKHEPLVSEDRGHTWVISIESLMGERNKIKSATAERRQKTPRNRRFLVPQIYTILA